MRRRWLGWEADASGGGPTRQAIDRRVHGKRWGRPGEQRSCRNGGRGRDGGAGARTGEAAEAAEAGATHQFFSEQTRRAPGRRQ